MGGPSRDAAHRLQPADAPRATGSRKWARCACDTARLRVRAALGWRTMQAGAPAAWAPEKTEPLGFIWFVPKQLRQGLVQAASTHLRCECAAFWRELWEALKQRGRQVNPAVAGAVAAAQHASSIRRAGRCGIFLRVRLCLLLLLLPRLLLRWRRWGLLPPVGGAASVLLPLAPPGGCGGLHPKRAPTVPHASGCIAGPGPRRRRHGKPCCRVRRQRLCAGCSHGCALEAVARMHEPRMWVTA